jgi:hypothetical protein
MYSSASQVRLGKLRLIRESDLETRDMTRRKPLGKIIEPGRPKSRTISRIKVWASIGLPARVKFLTKTLNHWKVTSDLYPLHGCSSLDESTSAQEN